MSAFELPWNPPLPERCRPPVLLDADGHPVPDPRVVLGLPAGPLDPDAVRAAWQRASLDHPAERDPDGAERVRRARDRLLDPAAVLEREIGVLLVPDPVAWGLPGPVEPAEDTIAPEARLLGQLALYALVEEALWTEGLGALFAEAIAAHTNTATR